MKLEQATGDVSKSLIVNSTVANEWEVLSFDYTGEPSLLYDRIVIIFDKIPGQIGDGSAMSTYYFDDIVFETGPVPGCTDTEANNYNPSATIDDGSCTYGVIVLNITGNPCMK